MKTLVTALMMSMTVLSAGAYASPNHEPNNTPFQGVYGTPDASGVTRAQVEADLATAKAAGLVSNVEPNNVPFQGVYGAAPSGSQKSRADVQAELAASKASGEFARMNDLYQGS